MSVVISPFCMVVSTIARAQRKYDRFYDRRLDQREGRGGEGCAQCTVLHRMVKDEVETAPTHESEEGLFLDSSSS